MTELWRYVAEVTITRIMLRTQLSAMPNGFGGRVLQYDTSRSLIVVTRDCHPVWEVVWCSRSEVGRFLEGDRPVDRAVFSAVHLAIGEYEVVEWSFILGRRKGDIPSPGEGDTVGIVMSKRF